MKSVLVKVKHYCRTQRGTGTRQPQRSLATHLMGTQRTQVSSTSFSLQKNSSADEHFRDVSVTLFSESWMGVTSVISVPRQEEYLPTTRRRTTQLRSHMEQHTAVNKQKENKSQLLPWTLPGPKTTLASPFGGFSHQMPPGGTFFQGFSCRLKLFAVVSRMCDLLLWICEPNALGMYCENQECVHCFKILLLCLEKDSVPVQFVPGYQIGDILIQDWTHILGTGRWTHYWPSQATEASQYIN